MMTSRGQKWGPAMARQTLLALLMLVLAVTPARAQTGKVLLDMTIQTLPGIPSGHCLHVDDGRFLVEGRLLGDNPWPVRFFLGPALNVPANLELRFSTPDRSSSSTNIEGGVYCYALVNEAVVPGDQSGSDQAPHWEQPIALRLIWLPAPQP
jgi:hypothetical protein